MRQVFEPLFSSFRNVAVQPLSRRARQRQPTAGPAVESCESRVLLSANSFQTLPRQAELHDSGPRDVGGRYGSVIDVSDSYIAVGVPRGVVGNTTSGLVELYDAQTMQPVRTIENPTPAANDQFGFSDLFGQSVALSDSTLIVGAPLDDPGVENAGAVHVFDPATGNLQFSITGQQESATFGFSVALDPATGIIVVGEPQASAGADFSGAVSLYSANGQFLHRILDPNPQRETRFGHAVAIDDGHLVVGNHYANVSGPEAGEIHIFDVTTGALERTIANPTPQAFDQFGLSVDIVGNKVLVGSPRGGGVGEFFLFDRDTGNEVLSQAVSTTAVPDSQFGVSVALTESHIVVEGPPTGDRQAHVFDHSGKRLHSISYPEQDIGADFGRSLVMAGDTIVVGTPLALIDGQQTGGAFVYEFEESQFSLLKDINTAPDSAASQPRHINVVGDKLFYFGATEVGRDALFVTDGTVPNTIQIDVQARTDSSYGTPTPVGDLLFFSAYSEGFGYELWKSDGTVAGTSMVEDILPGTGSSSLEHMTAVGDTLYFTTYREEAGRELWKSDGTPEGTHLVKDIWPGADSGNPGNLAGANGVLYFSAYTPEHGYELWTSDGTTDGTTMVRDIAAGTDSANPYGLAYVGGTIYFSARTAETGFELWKTDGTETGTVFVKDINSGASHAYPGGFTEFGGQVYFSARTDEDGYELWKTDGTTAGTVLVADIDPGTGSSGPNLLTEANGVLYFRASTPDTGSELWKSDGTTAGTTLVKDIYSGADSGLRWNLVAIDDVLYFEGASPEYGRELWTSDGTSVGTTQVKDIRPGDGDSAPQGFVDLGGTLFFGASSPGGFELWRSDGTDAGTESVDVVGTGTSDASPQQLTRVGDSYFFRALTQDSGWGLWRTKGTPDTTHLVKDVNPDEIAAFGGTLYFGSWDAEAGYALWKSDGTESGTTIVRDGFSSYPRSLTIVGDTLYFRGATSDTGHELWKSDGTTSGTVLVKDIWSGPSSSSPFYLQALGSSVFFSAYVDGIGTELWKSDGTSVGTVLVRDINPGQHSSQLHSFVASGDTLYFSAYMPDTGQELWKSDGTSSGTQLVKDIEAGADSSSPQSLAVVSDTVYFSAVTSQAGRELWKSDGTAAGTTLIRDIEPGAESSFPSQITALGDAGYFEARNATHGSELWKTDGTEAGTEVIDLVAGPESSSPGITRFGELGYVTANSLGSGQKLHRIGGATGQIEELAELPGSAWLVGPINGRLIASIHTDTYGRELWASDATLAPTEISLGNNLIAEQLPAGTYIGELSTTDGNLGDQFTYELIDDPESDNTSFAIDRQYLRTAAPLDRDTKATYRSRVMVTDPAGLTHEQDLEIHIANEIIPVPMSPDNPEVPHYAHEGAQITLKAVLRNASSNRYRVSWDVDRDGDFDDELQQVVNRHGSTNSVRDLGRTFLVPDVDSDGRMDMDVRVVDLTTGTEHFSTFDLFVFDWRPDNDPRNWSDSQIDVMAAMALQENLWYLHRTVSPTSGSGATISGQAFHSFASANYLQTFVEAGRLPAYPADSYSTFGANVPEGFIEANDARWNVDPYAETSLRLTNYLLSGTQNVGITSGEEGLGNGQDYAGYDPSGNPVVVNRLPGTTDRRGIRFTTGTHSVDGGLGQTQGVPLAALSPMLPGLAGTRVQFGAAAGQTWEWFIQQAVDYLGYAQSDSGRGAGAWGDVVNDSSNFNEDAAEALSYATIGLQAAESNGAAYGIVVNNRHKYRTVNALYQYQSTDGGIRRSPSGGPGSFNFTGGALFASRWLGIDNFPRSSQQPFPGESNLAMFQLRDMYDHFLSFTAREWTVQSRRDNLGWRDGLWIRGDYLLGNTNQVYHAGAFGNSYSMYFHSKAYHSFLLPIDSIGGRDHRREFLTYQIRAQARGLSTADPTSSYSAFGRTLTTGNWATGWLNTYGNPYWNSSMAGLVMANHNPFWRADFTVNPTVGVRRSLDLKAMVGGASEYFWDFDPTNGLWWETGATPDAVGENISHTFDDYGDYRVTLRAGENTLAKTITVAPRDLTAPTATVQTLPSTTTTSTFDVTVALEDVAGFEGDLASGVASWDLYSSDDGLEWNLFQAGIPATQTVVTVQADSHTRYWFRAEAVDNAGNRESEPGDSEATTITSDVTAPETTAGSASSDANGVITVPLTGTDIGNSGLESFLVMVSVDGGALEPATPAPIPAGAPSNGTYFAQLQYQALRDSTAHTYDFFVTGTDGAGNTESASASADASISVTADPPVGLAAEGIDVQLETTQRSYIRSVDILFNDTNGLADLINNGRIEVERFALDSTNPTVGTGAAVTGFGTTASGNSIQLDFGTDGIGGRGHLGNGFYRILLDMDGDGAAGDAHFEFFRLYGDSNGDGQVDRGDRRVSEDLTGDGRVTSADRRLFRSEGRRGDKLDDSLFDLLDD